MCVVAGRATLDLCRRVLEDKRSLLVRVTLHTCLIRAGSQADLLEFESAVLIVTIRALHDAFKYAVMKRLQELGPGFVMAGNTKLRIGLH
jgi:hypothetical protein